MAKITVIGSGMMGSALSVPLTDNGHDVHIVGTYLDDAIIDRLIKEGVHKGFERRLPDTNKYYYYKDMLKAVEGADLIINGVSSFGIDWFAEKVIPVLPDGLPIISVTKGLYADETGALTPFPELLEAKNPDKHHDYFAIGGPCTSYELVDKNDSAVCFCGKNYEKLLWLRDMFRTPYYHVSVSTDVAGVECAVAIKNLYAGCVSLGIGMEEARHGIGCIPNNNLQAALFGQSVREMSRLIALMGGDPDNMTYAAGDLYVTIYGGRTRKLGTLLGRGIGIKDALQQLGGLTLENISITTAIAKALRARAARGEISLDDYPLVMHYDSIINQNSPVNIPWDKMEVK